MLSMVECYAKIHEIETVLCICVLLCLGREKREDVKYLCCLWITESSFRFRSFVMVSQVYLSP